VTDDMPDVIRELATGCVRAVQQAVGFELDYTPETLSVLDHWLGLAETTEGAVVDLLAAMAGAYFGEVIIRALPTARWHAPPGAPARWRIEIADVFLCVNPAGVAREAIARDEVAGWNAHLRMDEADRRSIEGTLATLGDVEEDDYYRFTVRFEVLEHAYEALRARALTRRGTTPRFGPELYAAAYDRDEPGHTLPS
jgi:hypothetical protein